jgi:PAS domain S-box-containing protein
MADRTLHAIVMSDAEGRIRHWSAGAEKLFGHDAEEALGRSLDLIVPPDFREKHWAGFRRAMSTGVCNADRSATNLPVLCKDGVVRAFPARFVFLLDARDQPAGALAIYGERAGAEEVFGPILEL